MITQNQLFFSIDVRIICGTGMQRLLSDDMYSSVRFRTA